MKQIKKYLTVKWCAMISALLGMLGFAACGSKDDDDSVASRNVDSPNPNTPKEVIIEEGPCLYGQPYAKFKVEGAVFNEEGLVVEGVKIYVRDNYGDTTKTDQDGKFEFKSDDIMPFNDLWVIAEDPSGVYEADSVQVDAKFEGGDRDWYYGSYSTTQNFTLKKKPAEPSEPENPEKIDTPQDPETPQEAESSETPSTPEE